MMVNRTVAAILAVVVLGSLFGPEAHAQVPSEHGSPGAVRFINQTNSTLFVAYASGAFSQGWHKVPPGDSLVKRPRPGSDSFWVRISKGSVVADYVRFSGEGWVCEPVLAHSNDYEISKKDAHPWKMKVKDDNGNVQIYTGWTHDELKELGAWGLPGFYRFKAPPTGTVRDFPIR